MPTSNSKLADHLEVGLVEEHKASLVSKVSMINLDKGLVGQDREIHSVIYSRNSRKCLEVLVDRGAHQEDHSNRLKVRI